MYTKSIVKIHRFSGKCYLTYLYWKTESTALKRLKIRKILNLSNKKSRCWIFLQAQHIKIFPKFYIYPTCLFHDLGSCKLSPKFWHQCKFWHQSKCKIEWYNMEKRSANFCAFFLDRKKDFSWKHIDILTLAPFWVMWVRIWSFDCSKQLQNGLIIIGLAQSWFSLYEWTNFSKILDFLISAQNWGSFGKNEGRGKE